MSEPETPRKDTHFRRLVAIWVVLCVVLTPVAVIVQHTLPPGDQTNVAQGEVLDNEVLIASVTIVSLAIVVFFAYVLIAFRSPPGDDRDGEELRGHPRLGIAWLAVTGVIVTVLAVYGTVRLVGNGAGGGQGAAPVFKPSTSDALEVQVVAQQWQFTYRFPSYGGLETHQLRLPAGRRIEFHVTSLDVVHSFWARQIGVKADANPGVDNVAYAVAKQTGRFDIRCSELCGLWHGNMSDKGYVVAKDDFDAWARRERTKLGAGLKSLPPYRHGYLPAPGRRAG